MYSIIKNYKHTDWQSPKSCETAIGAQLQLVTFFGLVASYLFKEYGRGFCKEATAHSLSKSLTLLSKYSVLASAISFVPISVRAWQNKKETTSLLTLAGVPLAATYQVLHASPLTLDPRKGLFVIGFPLINEGNLCNSKHYRNQVDYLKFIYSKAVQNPQLRAEDFLNYLQTNPQEIDMMTKAMGPHRVDFIRGTLQNAKQEQIKNNTTLGVYLRPMMQENGSY